MGFNDKAIARQVSRLSVPERHQLKVARSTMSMHCVGARIMGGPNHVQSAKIIHELSGVFVNIDADCTC